MKIIKLEERVEIYRLLKLKYSLRKIAKKLNRSVSSISGEIKLGGGKEKYNPVLSNKRSKKKKQKVEDLKKERLIEIKN